MRNLKGITFTTKPSTRSGLATVSEKNKKKGVSKEEKDLLASLKSLFPRDTRIVENDRTILGGKEIDILIRKKIQLEMNKKALEKDETQEASKKLDDMMDIIVDVGAANGCLANAFQIMSDDLKK